MNSLFKPFIPPPNHFDAWLHLLPTLLESIHLRFESSQLHQDLFLGRAFKISQATFLHRDSFSVGDEKLRVPQQKLFTCDRFQRRSGLHQR